MPRNISMSYIVERRWIKVKKISLFSRIIFILQAFVVLYPIIWIPIRILKIEVDISLLINMYGIYLAIPVAVVGVLLCLVLLVKQRNDKKEVFKNMGFAFLHIVLGMWNFVFYNSLWHI